MSMNIPVVEYIKSKILKAQSKNKKLRVIGANFGINLYDNRLYQDEFNDIKYISLKKYEFKPFLTPENTLICHPNNISTREFLTSFIEFSFSDFVYPEYDKLSIDIVGNKQDDDVEQHFDIILNSIKSKRCCLLNLGRENFLSDITQYQAYKFKLPQDLNELNNYINSKTFQYDKEKYRINMKSYPFALQYNLLLFSGAIRTNSTENDFFSNYSC